ncbi:VpsF family polysaccharide biosynthesis protein [Colwellia sp. E2M01]|uniref:VpsF family polysaccharide biosynthesis protein n=1 Tax=Colwellia sp. E2M01 TaxID=2841561 RepID=UPI001C09A7C2|nr:VpsF family polysaccharide biosynthesis protein [Colwellia sp. E2M01]MBU2870037.1 VpsF family polysaccharide biosynthesis protein [Colwellia sp. E2M01]
MNTLPKIPFLFILLSMLSVFVLSGDVLILFGYNFLAEGGSFLFKIHPSFYLLFLAYISIFLYKSGSGFLYKILFEKQNLKLLIACLFCFFYQVLILKQPMAPFIVTWLFPVLILCLYKKFHPSQIKFTYQVVILIISFNALMGILEYAQGGTFISKNYFSMESEELLDISEWGFQRANALYGHPLIATLISAIVVAGFYAKSLVTTLTRNESICFFLSLLSLPAFGGRTSIAVSLLILTVIASIKFYRVLKGVHIPQKKMILIVSLILTMPVILLLMFDLGLFDSVLDRLADDNGSAETRLTAFYILFDTSVVELLFGDVYHQLFYRQLLYGTKYGIEIFWLAIILQYGVFVSIALVYILVVIHKYIYKHIGHFTLWPSLAFLLALSSGTGLASKSLMLSQFIIISLFLFNQHVTDKS